MTTVAIHQPGYLPWLGFFKKMMNSDIFVFLDDAQYEKKDWDNRNMIRTSTGSTWLTVPVHGHHDLNLNQVKIDDTKHWSQKHKKSILLNYSKANYFEKHRDFIDQFYEKSFDLLIDVNMEFIYYVIKKLEIKTKTLFSSTLKISEKGSDRVLNICKALDADVYISGTLWAKNHLQVEDFTKNHIKVKFQNFQHPVYRQLHGNFIPNMSIVDLLFNEGENSKQILLNSITI